MALTLNKGLKIALLVLGVLALVFMVRLVMLGRQSQAMTPLIGVVQGKLRGCASAGNCQTSSLIRRTPAPEYISQASRVLESMGGVVRTRGDNYLHVEFRSSLFGFVDDVELLLSPDDQVEVRSASRVGKSDLGANFARLEKLTQLLGK